MLCKKRGTLFDMAGSVLVSAVGGLLLFVKARFITRQDQFIMGSKSIWYTKLPIHFSSWLIDWESWDDLIQLRLSKKAIKVDQSLLVTLQTEIQINWEILSNFCGLLRKPELYEIYCHPFKLWLIFYIFKLIKKSLILKISSLK